MIKNCQKILIIIVSYFCIVMPVFAQTKEIRGLYTFYNQQKQDLSVYINGYIHEKKHFEIRNYPENGFFYFYPNRFPFSDKDEYIFINSKQINNDVFLFVKNNKKADIYRKQLLSYLVEKGIKFHKIKDGALLKKLEDDGEFVLKNYNSVWKDSIFDKNLVKFSMERYVGYDRQKKVDMKDSIIWLKTKSFFDTLYNVVTLRPLRDGD